MPCVSLADRMGMDLEDLIPYLRKLILSEKVSIVYGDRHPNPFIRALCDDTSNEQLAKLIPEKLEYACIYPQNSHLEGVVNKHMFFQRPYTLKLALGNPLYSFDFFDPIVLNYYIKHPECSIINDIQGTLNLPYTTVHFSRATYSTAAGQPITELLALSLEQLVRLSDSDQEYWHSMSIPVDCNLHPDIEAPLMEGHFRQRLSVFEALQEEINAVNALCSMLGKPSLFLSGNDYLKSQGSTPDIWHIGFLIPATLDTFSSFFLQFQIQLMQNINPDFLSSLLPSPIVRKVGRRTSTIWRPSKTALERVEAWMVDTFAVEDSTPIAHLVQLIKKTRKSLEKRLSKENPHLTDPALLYKQRRLMWNAYISIRWIRIQFEEALNRPYSDLHPLARAGKIWVR